ncbi:MAG: hypothetical protein FIA99_16680 [Ruminiclostridium sp.]|nr:hypothetical protein [Ruminiclostridium sp.]
MAEHLEFGDGSGEEPGGGEWQKPKSKRRNKPKLSKQERKQLLLTQIVDQGREYWLGEIRRQLDATRDPNPDKTACLMWKLGSINSYDVGISGRANQSVRSSTVCAEEELLDRPDKGYIFSLAGDRKIGLKPACRDKCRLLLNRNQIQDLFYNLRDSAYNVTY